jgi:hypothetical protein
MIDFGAIRDDGSEWRMPFCWKSAGELVRTFVGWAEDFTLDRQEGQPTRVVFAVEAAGMAPMVEEIAAPYGIGVIPSGGFGSVTGTHDMAQRLGKFDRVEVLQIGGSRPIRHPHLFFPQRRRPGFRTRNRRGDGSRVYPASRNPGPDRPIQSPENATQSHRQPFFPGPHDSGRIPPSGCVGRYSPLGDYRPARPGGLRSRAGAGGSC